MTEPSQSDSAGPSQPTADEFPLLRLAGMDLLTVNQVATEPDPADAPFRVVTDGRTISCFRQSAHGSLYVDRFVLVQLPGQDSASAPAWVLRRVWEVRYRRSELRDVPVGQRDTLNARNLLGQPFLEPTAELSVIAGIENGGFDVALAPTSEADRMRWHIMAITGSTLTCLSYPQDSTGRIDLSPATARSFTISPAVFDESGDAVTVAPYMGLALAVYQEQEQLTAADGTTSSVRRATRLMATVPVRNPAAGLPAALAVYDFMVQPDGTVPAYPARAACTPLDGTLNGGTFTPAPGDPNYPVPDQAVLAVGSGTVASVLLGQPQPGAAPALLDGSDGLVHLYFEGTPPYEVGSPGAFLVAQHDPTVTRVSAAVPWTTSGASGTFPLIGLRAGTSLNGLSAAVTDCSGQPDLCTLSISYGTGSGLPDESWQGMPRDALTMISVLNGQSSDDPSDPAVISGATPFYDLHGRRAMARLPVSGGTDSSGYLTLASRRPDVPLAGAVVTAPADGTVTLTLSFTLPGGQTASQTWAEVPTDTTYLVPVLSGAASGYTYLDTGAPVYGLATDGASILLFAASAAAVTLAIATAASGDPASCDLTIQAGDDQPIVLAGIGRDQASLVAALRGSAAASAVFTYISPDPLAGLAPNQSVTAPLDLRDLSTLFDVVQPAPAGDLAAGTVTAGVLQGRSFRTPPPDFVPVGRGALAVSALPPAVPLFGLRPAVANGTCAITQEGTNGQWLAGAAPSALSFNEDNAMTVATPGQSTAPGRTWTIEAWACPTDGTPSSVVTYNGSSVPPLAGVVPSYFLGTVGQPALEYTAFQPTIPYAGSYVNVPAYPAFTPASGQGFTWEAWVRPEEAPCPSGGTRLLGCVLQAQDTVFPDTPQWQLGLDFQRTLTFGLRTGPAGDPAEFYIAASGPLPASTWTHVAVTGAFDGNSWTVTLYQNATAVQVIGSITPYPAGEAPFLCIGASDIQNVSMFGALAEIRFWTFPATAAELQRTMHTSLSGNEPGLAGYWPLTEDPQTQGVVFHNYATATGQALDGSLNTQSTQEVTSSNDGSFVSLVAGVGGAPALLARAFLPANHWNHLAAVYQAAGGLSLNPSGIGAARADFGVCSQSAGLDFGQSASVEAWVQMSTPTNMPQTILAQWGESQQDQAFQFGVDANGYPYCTVTLESSSGDDVTTLTGTSTVNVIDGKHHHLAAVFAGNPGAPTYTISMYVDGQAQQAVTTGGEFMQVVQSSAPVTLGISALSSPATGVVAYSAQAPFLGVLTGVRFWSVALTQAQVKAAMNGHQAADGGQGMVSAWWFTEQTGISAADTVSGNDLTLSDTDMWATFAAISTLDIYGNGVPLGLVESAPDGTADGYQGDPQLTIGAYLADSAVTGGLSGQLAEVRLWSSARSRDQLIETMYRGIGGDEEDLAAYWTLNGTTADATGRGADGSLTGSPPPAFVPSLAPVANEGPQVRNVYGGPVTDFQEGLSGRAAIIEYAETETRWDGSPFAVMRRAYVYANSSLALVTGYGLGEMGLIYVGQVQTNPTLIGYIEGAPPCPSENLSRPLYTSVFGYNSYMDATSVTLEQTDTNSLTFSSQDYRTNVQMDLEMKLGVRAENESNVMFPPVITSQWHYKGKIGVKHKASLSEAAQVDERYASSWTHTLTDTFGLRGKWEPTDQGYVNPVVGRRYQPYNFGYALVESLTADLYALQLRSTGAMVGRVVVPNLSIPPDRNVLTFQIDPAYVKNGTLDGKVGLVNDPSYPDADVQRGSYFKPEDAYARAALIDKEEANLRAYWEQFDAQAQGQAGPDHPSLSGSAGQQFYDFAGGRATRGIVNRYAWTALGGLHQETEQFSSVHEKTFTGLYSWSWGTGVTGEVETGATVGVFGGLDLLFGAQIKIQVGKSESEAKAVALRVSAPCDPMLQSYDAATGEYSPGFCPGKVDAYRFMTFYLPPSAANGAEFLQIVDPQWLQFSSDPNAIALRQAQLTGNGAWRVLHRVTYVSRVPPSLDTNPDQTIAPEPPQPIDVEDNAALIALVQEALGPLPPTPGNIGAAVATVLAPPDGTSPSVLGQAVPWWEGFVDLTRGTSPDPDAVKLMQRLLVSTITYMQAGYAAGVL